MTMTPYTFGHLHVVVDQGGSVVAVALTLPGQHPMVSVAGSGAERRRPARGLARLSPSQRARMRSAL